MYNEWGYMLVDGIEKWKGQCGAHSCSPDFVEYSGTFPNPWGGDRSGHKCYKDIDISMPHTSDTLKLTFKTNMNQGKSDESWGYSHVKLSIDSSCMYPLALGISEGGSIPDNRLTASSYWENNAEFSPARGRLHLAGNSWSAGVVDTNQWFSVNLGAKAVVTAIATQGRENSDQWVKSYTISFSEDGNSFVPYEEEAQSVEFGANSDRSTVVVNTVKNAFMAQFVRIQPKTWAGHISMRTEVYGSVDPYSVDGGGWELVRRVKAGNVWHPAHDKCAGTDEYGTPSDDVDSTFSKKFDTTDYNQVMFATGDMSKWLIATKKNVQKKGDNFETTVVMSSLSSSPYSTKWKNVQGEMSDPQISLVDHATAVNNGNIIYAEGSELAADTGTDLFGGSGAMVLIRNKEAPLIEWFVDQNDPGWTSDDVTPTSAGTVHGIWGNSPNKVERTWELPSHTKIQIRAKFWAIDSWDNEWGYMDVDGGQQWSGNKANAGGCGPDFESFAGSFPNPWGGDNAKHKCFHNINVEMAHSATTLKIGFRTNINQGKSDEGWAFGDVRISLDGLCHAFGSLGLENGDLADGRVTQSSAHGSATFAKFGRLNGGTVWMPKTADTSQWMQIDLGMKGTITAIATQGKPDADQWVKTYNIQYSMDGSSWSYYSPSGAIKAMTGNDDRNTVKSHTLEAPFMAQFVKISPQTWNGNIAMRAELYGCTDPYSIDGGGWELVRRVQAGGVWHAAKDQASGTEEYGTASSDPEAAESFSIKFNERDYNQVLFATGDAKKWLVTTKKQLERTGTNFDAKILLSSTSTSQYTAKWNHRDDSDEDPQVSIEDYSQAVSTGGILYAEDELSGQAATTVLGNHQGANMFVRKWSPPMVTWLSDVDGTGWDRKELTDTGYGKVHGIWGGEVKDVSQTFTGMPTHTEVKITARFWAIDSWDNEWGYMHIDGVEQWKGRCGAHTCTPDFQSYSGTFPNPWGVEKSSTSAITTLTLQLHMQQNPWSSNSAPISIKANQMRLGHSAMSRLLWTVHWGTWLHLYPLVWQTIAFQQSFECLIIYEQRPRA